VHLRPSIVPAPAPGAPRRPVRGRLCAVSPPRRTELTAIVVIYVVPLTAALVFLVAVGLWELALALAVVEAVVLAAVVWAKRTSP
jgi:hypothetical protein